MTSFTELAIDFLGFCFYLVLATVVGAAILLVVGETVDHFTP